MKNRVTKIVVGLLFLAALAHESNAATTTKYTYDALGRLTFVEDSFSGNMDYDYDAAGNRLLVSPGTANDAASEPGAPAPPAAPTGLSSPYIANCVWIPRWTAVLGATSYQVSDTQGVVQTVTGTSATVLCPFNNQNANKPKWVKACSSSTGLCSAKALF